MAGLQPPEQAIRSQAQFLDSTGNLCAISIERCHQCALNPLAALGFNHSRASYYSNTHILATATISPLGADLLSTTATTARPALCQSIAVW